MITLLHGDGHTRMGAQKECGAGIGAQFKTSSLCRGAASSNTALHPTVNPLRGLPAIERNR